jgi:hypothetical protein
MNLNEIGVICIINFSSSTCYNAISYYDEKNTNLVYEVVADVRFGHELANRKIDHEVVTH